MSKEYDTITKNDGTKCQEIDIMKEALGEEGYIIFCLTNAFKYITRIGRKEGEDFEKEKKKIFDYLRWCYETSDEITKKYIEKYKEITIIGNTLEENYKIIVKKITRPNIPTPKEMDAMIDEELKKYERQNNK